MCPHKSHRKTPKKNRNRRKAQLNPFTQPDKPTNQLKKASKVKKWQKSKREETGGNKENFQRQEAISIFIGGGREMKEHSK